MRASLRAPGLDREMLWHSSFIWRFVSLFKKGATAGLAGRAAVEVFSTNCRTNRRRRVVSGLGFVPALLVCCLWATHCTAGEAPQDYSHPVLIRFEGPITPMLQQYFYRKLDAAEQDKSDLVIVEIDSPGGFLEESLEIANRLSDTTWAHTLAYIPREALSGAAIVALGCDEIVMAKTAKLGDAGPIFLGDDALFRHAPEKLRSDLVVEIRMLAEGSGRPPALAAAMVDMDLVVYRVKNTDTGEETFMSEAELDSLEDSEVWEKGKPVHESREGYFLEVTGDRAVELRLAEANVANRQELKERYGIQGELTVLESSSVDVAVYILNHPFVTGLLFVIGLVALYIEFSMPGVGMGILTAGLCFALFFWSRFLGGTADWLELVLFVSGLAFLAVELFVLPGFGVAGLSGLLLLFCSLVLAGQTFVIPHTGRQLDTLTGTLFVLTVSGGTFLVLAVILSRSFGSLPFLSRLTLTPPDPEQIQPQQPHPQQDQGASAGPAHRALVAPGDLGIADSALRPAGKARFGNRFVDVITDGEFITKGSRVRVVQTSGSRVLVSEDIP